MARGRKASFTLVELLVVIGIIALLAALLLPVLAKASASARSARCRSREIQFYQGIRMYLNNSNEYFPTAWLIDSSGTSGDLSNLSYHRFLIEQQCEGNFKPTYNAATDSTTETIVQKFQRNMAFWADPASGWTTDYFCPTMVFKGPLTGNDINLSGSAPFDGNAQYNDIVKDVASSQRPMLTECDTSYAHPASVTDTSTTNTTHTAELTSGWTVCLATPPAGGSGVGPTADPTHVFVGVGTSSRAITSGGSGEIIADDNQSRFDARHNGSNNFLYADGHVSSVSSTDKMQLANIHERWENPVPAPGK